MLQLEAMEKNENNFEFEKDGNHILNVRIFGGFKDPRPVVLEVWGDEGARPMTISTKGHLIFSRMLKREDYPDITDEDRKSIRTTCAALRRLEVLGIERVPFTETEYREWKAKNPDVEVEEIPIDNPLVDLL